MGGLFLMKIGIFRLLNDEPAAGHGFYHRQIDFTRKDPFPEFMQIFSLGE
jgi:hypothetical protein